MQKQERKAMRGPEEFVKSKMRATHSFFSMEVEQMQVLKQRKIVLSGSNGANSRLGCQFKAREKGEKRVVKRDQEEKHFSGKSREIERRRK
ncbi:hypothetical protein VNO77_03022 [Canavalia gladiata]|uniref:Uncharacterized protein n=1 Tax=Canavalia gladiata TaxID=3824 RepID=A0AAN9MZM6_CANGL